MKKHAIEINAGKERGKMLYYSKLMVDSIIAHIGELQIIAGMCLLTLGFIVWYGMKQE